MPLNSLRDIPLEAAINNLGYFALGAFVGAIVSYGLKFAKDLDASAKAITIILPAALGGTAVTFLQLNANEPNAVAFYSMGLLIALMWAYCRIADENLRDRKRTIIALGYLHYLGVLLVNGVVAVLLLAPFF